MHHGAQPQSHLTRITQLFPEFVSWFWKYSSDLVFCQYNAVTQFSKHVFIIFFLQIRVFKFKSWRQQVFLCVATTNQISPLTTTLGTVREWGSRYSVSGWWHSYHHQWHIGSCSDNQWHRDVNKAEASSETWSEERKKNELGNWIVGKFDKRCYCGGEKEGKSLQRGNVKYSVYLISLIRAIFH